MIKVEYYTTTEVDIVLYRTYSDNNMMIERDGILYEEAIDPSESGRIYNETNIPIGQEEVYLYE